MSKFIPVDPEKWAKMVHAQSDLRRYKEICDELDARCNELKAENQRLRASSFVTAVPSHQYERVIKAGDELHAFLINYIVESRISSAYLNKLDDDWHAAKEGKQP